MRTLLYVIIVMALLLIGASPAAAQISIIQGSDGTSGTIVDLGNGFRTYSDSHGNSGTIIDFGGGLQTYQFSSPRGQSQSGSILSFGEPTPPQGITPAPILPFTPHGPIMQRGSVVPVVPMVPLTPGSGAGGSVTPGVGVFGSGRGR
ncbi:MAG: hypothetical protein HY581_10285 [Nitrospirae bacterium]|nr:hypothetical protein [Nitrospirota bacterium]